MLGPAALLFSLLFSALLFAACESTSHATSTASIGTSRPAAAMEAVIDVPGPLAVETVAAADWSVGRGGVINLKSPAAKAAKLDDSDEPVTLYVHAIRHPTRGLFLVDTGAEHAFTSDPDHAVIHGLVGKIAHIDKLKVRTDTQSLLEREATPVAGVFLTHLHIDHVMGMRDVPAVPIYVGAGDARERSLTNLLASRVYDTALEGKAPLNEIRFTRGAGSPDANPETTDVLDLFGDGSFWAISVPGHTQGSIAYLARTTSGPVLLTGDACITAWGWQHDVEPGTLSEDVEKSKESLDRLERLVARHPRIDVRLGHQALR